MTERKPHLDGIGCTPHTLANLWKLQQKIEKMQQEIGTMEHNLYDGVCMARELGHVREEHQYGTYRIMFDKIVFNGTRQYSYDE